MSDLRLRELERRWNETGLASDEAAWLRERVRSGEVTQEQLVIAAILEHSAARAVLGSEREEVWERHNSVKGVFEVIGEFDHTLPLRVSARAAGHLLEEVPHLPEIERLQVFLNALEEIIFYLEKGRVALDTARGNLLNQEQQVQLATGKRAHYAFTSISNPNIYTIMGSKFVWGRLQLSGAFDELALALWSHKRTLYKRKVLALNQLKHIAFAEAVRYLLGYGDDLRERVEARARKKSHHQTE